MNFTGRRKQMQSLLVPVSDDDGLESRMQAALDICRAANGQVTFIHGAPLSDYIALDPFGGAYYVAEQRKASDEQALRKEDMINERMASEDVSWNFVYADGTPDDALLSHSRMADVAVVSEPPNAKDEDDLAASATYFVMAAHCPILAVPYESKSLDCTGKAVIAWNGSAPAARAMRAAVPMLKLANSVEVITIGEDPSHFPGEAACTYLSRHGVRAELVVRPRRGKIADAMHDLLIDRKADYLVMGAYGHTRFRETLFGGVTRHFIRQSPVPVFMTH
jgi:nucleotide-binding universal stress UspA family protein